MTDLVRKNRQKMSRQPSLFLSLLKIGISYSAKIIGARAGDARPEGRPSCKETADEMIAPED